MYKMKETAPPIYKKWEFKQFLGFLDGKDLGRALMYAKALGIDRRTLMKWLAQPEIAKPLVDSLDRLLDEMKKAGEGDWRMYRELIKILGLDDNEKLDLTTGGEQLRPITVEIIDVATKNTDT